MRGMRPFAVKKETSDALPGTVVVGIVNPAGMRSPFGKIIPVPFTVMSLTTIAKHRTLQPALFTAPLRVTLEFGRLAKPLISHAGVLPAAEISTRSSISDLAQRDALPWAGSGRGDIDRTAPRGRVGV